MFVIQVPTIACSRDWVFIAKEFTIHNPQLTCDEMRAVHFEYEETAVCFASMLSKVYKKWTFDVVNTQAL